MIRDQLLAELQAGDEAEGFYVLKAVTPKVANNGKPFLTVTLMDQSGTMEAKVWDYTGPIGQSDEGKIAKIRGTVSTFRNSLQMTVERIRLKEDRDVVDISKLVPVAPIDADAMFGAAAAIH